MTNVKTGYEKPRLELIRIVNDVIVTSGESSMKAFASVEEVKGQEFYFVPPETSYQYFEATTDYTE